MKLPRIAAALGVLALALATLSACSPSKSDGPHKIGLLLPDSVSARYETDHADFTAEVKKLDPTAKVVYGNADGSATTQLQQADEMLKSGVGVLVIDPYDVRAATSIVAKAKAKHIPVIDYDTLIDGTGSTYFVGSADQKAGQLQATALVAKLRAEGVAPGSGILMIDGPGDSQLAALTAKGAHSVIDASGYKVLAEYQTPGGVPNFAATWAQARFTELGKQIVGVYAANDGLAAGVLAAAAATHVDPTKLGLTGRGASFAAIQNLLSDQQLMTLYAPIKPEAVQAATVAVALASGKHPKAPDVVPATSGGSVPAFLLAPVVVTTANIRSTVIKDGFDSVAKICTRTYAQRCAALGIK